MLKNNYGNPTDQNALLTTSPNESMMAVAVDLMCFSASAQRFIPCEKTDFVLAGEDPGSKIDKAKALGVTILSEEDFVSRLE